MNTNKLRMELGKSINQISIDDKVSFSRPVTETDVILPAGITGDYNLIHLNEEYAKTTPFKIRIA